MMLEREKAFLKQLDKNYYSDSISDELLENASLDFLIELIKWSRSFYIRIPLEKRLMSLKLTQVAVEYGTYLGHIPKEHYFYDICLQATLNNSLSFSDVPEKFKDKKFYELVVKKYPQFYNKVPEKYLTYDITLNWAKSDYSVYSRHSDRLVSNKQERLNVIFHKIPKDHITEEFAVNLLENKNKYFPVLLFIQSIRMSDEFYIKAIKTNPYNVAFLPEELLSNFNILKHCLISKTFYNKLKYHFGNIINTKLSFSEFKNELKKKESILKQL